MNLTSGPPHHWIIPHMHKYI